MDIGTITGSELDENLDSDGKVRMLQVEMTDDEDIQLIEQLRIAGIDSNPPDDSTAFIDEAFDSAKLCIATDDGIEPSAGKGEVKIYSSADKTKKAEIYIVADGTMQITADNGESISISGGEITITADKIIIASSDIEIGGNADFAVRFNELKTQFDALRDKTNSLINAYNLHAHIYLPGPLPAANTAPPPVPVTPSTADISGAKVDKVKLP